MADERKEFLCQSSRGRLCVRFTRETRQFSFFYVGSRTIVLSPSDADELSKWVWRRLNNGG